MIGPLKAGPYVIVVGIEVRSTFGAVVYRPVIHAPAARLRPELQVIIPVPRGTLV